MSDDLPIPFSKAERDTVKYLCDLLCRAYGTSAGSNPLKLNVAGAAVALSGKIEAAEWAEARAQARPELVAVPNDGNAA